MTDYNDGKWHGWNGGGCPVNIQSRVEVIWQHTDGEIGLRSSIAGNIAFAGNQCGSVIAFRVTREHREPREFWVKIDAVGDLVECDHSSTGAMLVREVLDE